LKIDRHKYVRQGFHGFRELTSAERRDTYNQQVSSFTESNYVNIDTLFLLIDAILFSNLVDMKDADGDVITKSYEQIFKDVRMCVDLCHRDGVIKNAVMKDPAKHIIYDDRIVPMLQRLRLAGKKVKRLFTLTTIIFPLFTPFMIVYDALIKGPIYTRRNLLNAEDNLLFLFYVFLYPNRCSCSLIRCGTTLQLLWTILCTQGKILLLIVIFAISMLTTAACNNFIRNTMIPIVIFVTRETTTRLLQHTAPLFAPL
jgi:hypothetical protein